MKREFKPLWFLRGLIRPAPSGGLPALALPRGDELWTLPDCDGGKKTVRWAEGWKSCWHAILDEFLPSVQTRTFLTSDEIRKFEPANIRAWALELDDGELTQNDQQIYSRHGVSHARFLDDVCGWALDRTLEYARFRMGWGEWGSSDRPDAFFYSRPRSQLACRYLVRTFIDFANTRLCYHSLIESAVKRPRFSQVRSSKSAIEIAKTGKGRPKKVRRASNRKADEDLWLVLMWPVASRHGWSYRDVVRATRFLFRVDGENVPAPEITLKNNPKAVQAFFNSLHSGIVKFTAGEKEWRNKALVVRREDAEAMRLRVARLGLKKLPTQKRKNTDSVPRGYEFAATFRRI